MLRKLRSQVFGPRQGEASPDALRDAARASPRRH